MTTPQTWVDSYGIRRTFTGSDPRLPFQSHSETSKEAAKLAVLSAAKGRRMVLGALRNNGPMTDEQLQDKLLLEGSSERPRRVELVKQGLVRDSGRTHPTRSGRSAVLWEAT
jgi:hypothetical protein